MRRRFTSVPAGPRPLAIVTLIALLGGAAACGDKAPAATPGLSGPMSAAEPLLKSVGAAVPGLSQAQSILGIGSLMALAKAKMPPKEFEQVSSALPGAEVLMFEATKQGLPSAPGSLADVTTFLGKSGISASQVNQMVPALGQALGGKVSPSLATSFLGALK